MLTTTAPTTGTTTVRIKTLDSSVSRDDEKDLEIESEELPNNQPETEEVSASEINEEQATFEGLSTRASEIKDYLQQKTEVKAILLKQDGTVEEISYDASSTGTRKLLSGRPSIIGEIEDLEVVAVKSLSTTTSGTVNKNTLPVPLCNNKGEGDFVLFRVDSTGKAADVTLAEYTKYVDDHKALTATAMKNYSTDGDVIRSNSPFDTTATTSIKSLRGALETQIRAWSKGDEESAKKSDADIEKEVEQGLQKLVDEAVAAFTTSPMEDPDYKPEDDMETDTEDDVETIPHKFDDEALDDREWREQLVDALKHIEQIGKEDGEAYAEIICETFCEVNGVEPTLDQLTNLYDRIRTDFANEAEEELDDESEAEIESESESEVESEGSVDLDEEWEDALDAVRKIGKKDGRTLANSICDLFADVNGSEPTLEELEAVWELIQDELAEEAEIENETDSESDWESVSEDEEEEEYDPNNSADQKQAKKDAAEDAKHEVVHFDRTVLNTPMVTSKKGGGVSWNMYFNESDLNEEAEKSNLVQTVEGFKMMNGREPTQVEVYKMKQFLSVPNELMDGEEEIAGTSILLKSQKVSRGGGVSWTVYFDETTGSLKMAERSFLKMHGQKPTASELEQIRAFLTMSKPEEVDSDSADEQDSEQNSKRTPSKVLVSPVQEKKTAKRFNVYLEDTKLSQKETEQIAVKWFNRFNKREPTKEELSKIQAFIAKDADLKEQEFLVPVKALNFDDVDGDDDEKDIEPTATLKSSTKAVTTKKTATGYTLNFDDDAKDQDGDEEEAIKWFKRFNNREPAEDERQQIAQFMKSDEMKKTEQDEQEMIDIE